MTQKPNLISHSQRIKVGIKCYMTDTPAIGGRIKLAISDFIVREILLSGEILSTNEQLKARSSTGFESRKDRFTTFTLIKKNTDTILAGKILHEYLNLDAYFSDIKWLGIKDHTAITSQQFSIKGNHIEKLKKFKHPNITLTQIRPNKKNIELGGLWGNAFTINIRNIIKPYEELKDIFNLWKDEINSRGFPNYFGMQRFGQHRPSSHKIGKLFLKKRYKEAVEEFLFHVYPKEYPNIISFRQELEKSQNFLEGYNNCPNGLYYEKLIIEQLAREKNYLKALFKLPITLINLLISSFQSYMFNKAISERMLQGNPLSTPIKGDIIAILKDIKGSPSLVHYHYDGGDGWNDDAILKAFKHDRATIIAPIIGFKSKLSQFPQFEKIYSEILADEDFLIEDFKIDFPKLFKFEGTTRAIYNNPTNLEISQAYIINNYPEKDPYGVKLQFSLPKGTYATILLNELRKETFN